MTRWRRAYGAGRRAIFRCLVLVLLFQVAYPALPSRAAGPRFVRLQGDRFTLDGQRIVIKGSNYYQRNAPWAQMWQQWYGPQVEQEVAQGANELGLNALRVLVPYGATHAWNDDASGEVNPVMLDELRQLVQIAGAHQLRVIITLFDFYDVWPSAGTPTEAANLRYLTTIVEAFRDDDRVLAWDLHNEPDNYTGWTRDKAAPGVVDWLARMAAATRRLDPNHPLTTGLGNYRNYWYVAGPDLPRIIDLIDFVAFHAYEAPNLVAQVREIKSKTGKPIMLEEAGWPTDPNFLERTYNEEDQRWAYQALVDAIQAEQLAGATQWLLWDLVAGRSLRSTGVADWMGLFRWDGSRKPAGDVYAAWAAPRLPATVSTTLPLTGRPPAVEELPLYFPQTNHFVAAQFKKRWLETGGLELYGLPLTEPFTVDDYLVQYFERGVMEFHLKAKLEPGYDDLPPDQQLRRVVRLQRLGTTLTTSRAFPQVPPFTGDAQHWYFPETGHSLSNGFLTYWQQHGGLLQFGYPISEELEEVSPLDGRTHVVQYFERARFEYHRELQGTPFETTLGQLGREELQRRGWAPRP